MKKEKILLIFKKIADFQETLRGRETPKAAHVTSEASKTLNLLNVHSKKSKPCTVSPSHGYPQPFQQSLGYSCSFCLFVYTSSIFQLLILIPNSPYSCPNLQYFLFLLISFTLKPALFLQSQYFSFNQSI